MKRTVSEYDFFQAFRDMNRENQFSEAGLSALFDYLEQYEDDTGEEIELDVIALCCDFTEYEDIKEFQADYGDDYQTVEDIEQSTNVIMIDAEAFIIQAF